MRMMLYLVVISLSGCASLLPTDPSEARAKISSDLKLPAQKIESVTPCTFALTPHYVRRAQFTPCAFVVTSDAIHIARAVTNEQRFAPTLDLRYGDLRGFNLRIWGLGATQLQLLREDATVSIHLKSGGQESPDQPEEARRVAALLAARGVREVPSPGRVDPAVDTVIPLIIPAR